MYTIALEGNLQQVKHVHRPLLKAFVERLPLGHSQPEGSSSLHHSPSKEHESDDEDLLITVPGSHSGSGDPDGDLSPAAPSSCTMAMPGLDLDEGPLASRSHSPVSPICSHWGPAANNTHDSRKTL